MRKRYVFIIAMFLLFGCADYLDVNENPNETTTPPIQGLMSTITLRTGDNIGSVGYFTSYFVQYLAGPNEAGSTDTHEPVPYDGSWFGIYHLLGDAADLEILAREQGATHYEGVAKIVKAINLGLAIDVWGDIPYSDALFAKSLKPKYDDDQNLYTVVLNLLDDGIDDLNSSETTASIGEDDFIHSGDISKWIKTAHALKARYLNHASKLGSYSPDAVLASLANGFSSNNDNADVEYFAEDVNPWGNIAIRNAGLILDGWISEQIVDAMNGTTFGVVDPRMPFMFSITEFGTYIGTENGAGRGSADVSGERSVLIENTYYADRNSPISIISYAEQKFIEAEAYLIKNMKTESYNAYLAGIIAHMDMLGVDPVDRDVYVTNPLVSVGASNITLDLIMKEKYVALFLNPEAWTDVRRFDYQYTDMTVPANQNSELNGEFLRRVIYPESETTRNASNVPSVSLLSRIWWDQN
jgi:hypothetical protein